MSSYARIIIVNDLKMIELFAGIGGFQLAAEWVGGIETIASVEINPFCQKVLAKNHPKTPIYNDVTSYSPEIGKAQIVCGGSPCQDLSIAGKQKGIIKGKRSSLWFEQLRIYQESRATFLVWENVGGALRNGFGEVLRSLSEIGCNAEWQTISAASLGAPHLRERIFLIAYPSSLQFSTEPSSWSDQVGRQATIASTYPLSLREPQPQRRKQNKRGWSSNRIAEIATDTDSIGRNGRADNDGQNCLHQERDTEEDIKSRLKRKCGTCEIHSPIADTNGTSSQGNRCAERSIEESADIASHSRLSPWASIKPPICGVDAGLPNRLDRLAALGNAIVPQCAVVPLLRVKYLAELIT